MSTKRKKSLGSVTSEKGSRGSRDSRGSRSKKGNEEEGYEAHEEEEECGEKEEGVSEEKNGYVRFNQLSGPRQRRIVRKQFVRSE
jgi:hypothetical protein